MKSECVCIRQPSWQCSCFCLHRGPPLGSPSHHPTNLFLLSLVSKQPLTLWQNNSFMYCKQLGHQVLQPLTGSWQTYILFAGLCLLISKVMMSQHARIMLRVESTEDLTQDILRISWSENFCGSVISLSLSPPSWYC